MKDPIPRPQVGTFHGVPVILSAQYPKMQVSEEFKRIQTPELVEKTNAWMKAFFGWTEALPDGTVISDRINNRLIMNQATFNQLQNAMENYPC